MRRCDPEEPHFDEAQVRAILRRAVEIQAGGSGERTQGTGSGGVSLTQLRQAASELGLSPELIDRAAGEIGGERTSESGSRILGGPWNFTIEQTVNGRIGEEDWPVVLDAIRSASGRVGDPKTVGTGFEWTGQQDDTLHVSITPLPGGRSVVRVLAAAGVWGLVTHLVGGSVSAAAAGGLAAAADAPPLGKALVALGVLATGFAGARATFRHVAASRKETARRIMSAIQEHMAAASVKEPLSRLQVIEPEASQELRATST